MELIQPKRSKFKKCTKNYVKDNILDIIDIEETLSKNRYITKVPKSDFIYNKFLTLHENINQQLQRKKLKLKTFSKERPSLTLEALPPTNKDIPKQKYNPQNINFDVLNANKFDINFKKLKLEYKNGYQVLFVEEYYPIEIIGAGAFGLVISVIQIKTGKEMAVKIINKKAENYNGEANRLNNEVQILSRLNNPRIMKIYDLLDNHQYYFIFMELIKGGNLRDLIIKRYINNDKHLFRDSECSLIMKGIFEALNYLHKKNIIHRDIKPENILFKKKDDLSSVVLCDFGLAYKLDEYENSISGRCGTILYMAPELFLKKNYDKLVDSFSAGIVLYTLCSGGMHPFYKKGESKKEYIHKILQQKCLCKFSQEMPLLARNLFLKLCKFESIFRYEPLKALNHPWITRSIKSKIPMTILEEYNQSDKIKTFQALLSSVVSLVILKNHFNFESKKEKPILETPKTIFKKEKKIEIADFPTRRLFLTNEKKNVKSLFKSKKSQKKIELKKFDDLNLSKINNKSGEKNVSKEDKPFTIKYKNYFLKTNPNNYNSKNHKYNERYQIKNTLIIKGIKTTVNKKLMDNIFVKKQNYESKENNVMLYSDRKKNDRNIYKINIANGHKYNSIQNNKVCLTKHIIINSKNKMSKNDIKKSYSLNTTNTNYNLERNRKNNKN